ncbi:MAG: hypothetical protein RLZZ263_757 [Cyanobacteriota bacterium]|jgi:uncharacterized membrane protein AbrB (regulator of aidB expression)
MANHEGQKLTPREMVRAHAYPVLAAISTIALVVIAVSLGPIAKRAQTLNQCTAKLKTIGSPNVSAIRICQGE